MVVLHNNSPLNAMSPVKSNFLRRSVHFAESGAGESLYALSLCNK